MKREELKNLIRRYHQLNATELEEVTRNINSKLSEQILNLEIQNVRLDILCEELTKYFKQKGFKKVSFIAEPNCFAIVLNDEKLKTIAYPIFDYSSIDNKKVKSKRDYNKANIDFIKLISNYGLTGFSLFLKRFPDSEDAILNALKLTNQAKYQKALSGLINEQVNVNKILTQPQPESIIKKMIKREKVLEEKIETVKKLISSDLDKVEIEVL